MNFHCLFLHAQPVYGTVLAYSASLIWGICLHLCSFEKTTSQAVGQFLPAVQVWHEGQDLFQQADHEKTKLHKKSNFLTRDKQRQPHLRTKTNNTHSNFQCIFVWGTGHVTRYDLRQPGSARCQSSKMEKATMQLQMFIYKREVRQFFIGSKSLSVPN